MSKTVIFAPHCDDEVIGCFLPLIENSIDSIYYFNEVSSDRLREVDAVRRYFNLRTILVGGTNIPDSSSLIERLNSIDDLILEQDTLIYVPNIEDKHPDHKLVNLLAKTHFSENPKRYYSVDMNVSKLSLETSLSQKKKELLYHLYPTQALYFDTHPQAYIFESSVQDDIRTSITISTNFEGFHCYPNAPDEVAFLRSVHRHIFYVDVTVQVKHDDRELEFFMVKREIDSFIKDNLADLNMKSCEMIGRKILYFLLRRYPNRDAYSIHVSEDKENGATVTFNVR